ncbi:sigma-54-dependent Fis family transcriptional regulator [Saccharobesus litoralis]|uniref:Sigma-54-dependent Fis family transcriptional regulator n=1 Tax=Saccharobesus litoralis TaxID=2172099 RepID=A0A2S0VMD1_9ALTE|nr:sigma-54 dependent transcriptional regulator [Saccharobesus litoralis]AWB65377.1 sigma-54-dependent Fis family transcriptional regulator [Saccharobesus litoralis]
MTKPHVLLVEDTSTLAAIYQEYLKKEPIDLKVASSGKEALAAICERPPQVILLDLKLPDMQGQQILSWLKQQDYPCIVIVITAHSTLDVAIDVMKAGAEDFLEKPFDASRLITTVRNALKRYQLENIVEELQTSLGRERYHGFIGNSLPMQAVYRIIDAAAASKASIFITGESGTGKEVCAEAIHKQGPRRTKEFIPLNCAAIPKDLMESEIFGHLRGAFTGAANERKGAAELADGGTLFLDEIGEMDMELQSKLLRFIQTGTFQKVGSSKLQKVDVRFVCATNRDPLEEVKAGRFREDLYYRLHVIPVHLPPLRERGSDISKIAKSFLNTYAKEENKPFKEFSREVETRLNQYEWPGNIRQLQNVIRNIVVLHSDTQVKLEHLPHPLNAEPVANSPVHVDQPTSTIAHNETPEISADKPINATNFEATATDATAPVNLVPPATSHSNTPQVITESVYSPLPQSIDDIQPLAYMEKAFIEQAIELCQGNIPKAAKILEVSPSTIYRKKQAWEDQGL